MAELKDLPNKEAIVFFEEIRKIFPLNENGEIDASKVDFHMFEGKENSPAAQYLLRKLPEFFSRGCTVFAPLYNVTGKTSENPEQTFDVQLFSKLSKGDLSDLKEFEAIYPNLQTIAKYIVPKLFSIDDFVNKKLWKENLVLQEYIDKNPQFKEVYEQIIKDHGMFKYNGSLGGSQVIEIISKDAPPEDKELLDFALKVTKFWDLAESEEMFNERAKSETLRQVENEKNWLEERNRELEQLKRDLKEIDAKIAKYNVLTSITRKKEKIKDLETRVKIVKQIERQESGIKDQEQFIQDGEEKIAFMENYEEKYNQVVKDVVIPKIKEDLSETVPKEDQEELFKLIDKLFVTENNNTSLLKKADDTLHSFGKTPYTEYVSKLNNALITIAGISKSLVEFEKQDNKTLKTLLNAARGELMSVPTDGDHGKLEDGYRKHNLSSFSDFMDSTPDYREVPERLERLDGLFQDLMQEENLEEYVKKVGILWYKFVQIHPFSDGNGRTGRYIINMLLAHKNIVIPALYTSRKEEYQFNRSLDEFTIMHLHSNFDALGEEFLKRIREKAIDLTGQNRLKPKQEELQEIEETALEEGPKL